MAFGNKQENSQKTLSTSFLGKGTYIDGKFQVEGNVRMDGNFKGEINGNADLIIGEGAYVEANVNVRNLTIMGELHGIVKCTEKLEIHNTGKVVGEIKAGKLIIEENAIFEVTSSMARKEDKKEDKQEKQSQTDQKVTSKVSDPKK
jgi:cytoskeletal protein CcmA (bactofilin family)